MHAYFYSASRKRMDGEEIFYSGTVRFYRLFKPSVFDVEDRVKKEALTWIDCYQNGLGWKESVRILGISKL